MYSGTDTSFSDNHVANLSEYFFYLFMDAEKLFGNKQVPRLKKYAAGMKSLTMKGSAKEDSFIELDGTLYFKELSVNSLGQWLYLMP